MPTAFCIQAFVTMTANKMASLIEALVMEASLNFKTVRFHLLKENALESPVHTNSHMGKLHSLNQWRSFDVNTGLNLT